MSLPLSQLPCYVLMGLLWTVFCQAQRAVTDNICIDDRDCTNNGHICLQETCTPQSALQCPNIVVQTTGEETLVSHLRPVTIQPPGSTCGQNGNNNVIGINVRYLDPPSMYFGYTYHPMFESESPRAVEPPPYMFEELPRPPINEEDFVSQICGVEETVCTERHPRDQRLLIHVSDRQTIGGPQCANGTAPSTPTQLPRGISFTGRRRRQAGDETVVQSCTMTIGENLLGPTGNATLAMRFLLKNTA